jgi:2-haloacid dehalogenase
MLSPLAAANGLSHFFQNIFSVDALQIYKPRPDVYQYAVNQLSVPKDAIGFVSSNYWDIAGATSFGFHTYWLNRRSAVPDGLGVTPNATLTTLADLSLVR